ncbi:hypothetical protein ACHAQA_004865 [Verticillium albo-atrum]
MAPTIVTPAENRQQDGQSLDDLVMGFQRRAPLVNRGYHLRIKVIDTIVRNFLREPTSLKKVVVNLGCGSDVLPWQTNARYPELARDTLFIDVDFPDLMERKRKIVLANPELSSLLGSSYATGTEGSPILLQSVNYCLVACDLRQPSVLEECLSTIIGSSLSEVSFLFVAEVSITYLETKAADEVIRWASTLGTAQFCLLEQMLPDGPGHPFATTMMNHFSKMNTPLRSVLQYPTLTSQNQRFKSRGWSSVQSWPLWEAWSDDHFMSAAERNHLDTMEPFDEWEEFALFGGHYFILHASSQAVGTTDANPEELKGQYPDVVKWPAGMRLDRHPPGQSLRRFGAALRGTTPEGHDYLCHVLGQGPGGMREDGTVNESTYFWQLDATSPSKINITFSYCADKNPYAAGLHPIVHRFGASCQAIPGGYVVLFGGVTAVGQLPQELDVLVLKAGVDGFEPIACLVDSDESRRLRPFFVGSSVIPLGQDQFVVLGGGATCYGFGGYWSSGTHSILFDSTKLLDGKASAQIDTPRSVRFAQTSDIETDTTSTAASTGTQDKSRGPIGRARHAVDSTFTQTSSGLGVGLLGAVVGGLAASAHSGRSSEPDRSRLVSTVVGALVGGLGANAIEKRFENARERHRREQEAWERKWRAPEDRPRRGASRSREPGRRDSGWGGDDDFGMQGRRAPRRLASQDGFQYRG